jgi:hypothetical protein
MRRTVKKPAQKYQQDSKVKVLSFTFPSDPTPVTGSGATGQGSFQCSGSAPTITGHYLVTVHAKCFIWVDNATPPTGIPALPDNTCTLCSSVSGNTFNFGALGPAKYTTNAPYPLNTVVAWYTYRSASGQITVIEQKDFGGRKA